MRKPNMQPIFEEFYAKAEAIATEAKSLDTDAQQRAKTLEQDTQQDAQDRAALAEMERQVAALQAKVDAQAERLTVQRAELKAVEDDRDERKAEAQAIVEIVEREKARLAEEIKPPALVKLPGAVPPAPEHGGPAGATRNDGLPPGVVAAGLPVQQTGTPEGGRQ